MTVGVIWTPEAAAQVERVVKDILRRERNLAPGPSTPNTPAIVWQWAIANEAIDAASNGATNPGSGEVEVLKMNTDTRQLERSTITHTGVNRSEHISIDAQTLLIIARFKGEQVIIWADCSPMGSPPA